VPGLEAPQGAPGSPLKGSITVFAPGADGNVQPERVLSGRSIGTRRPGTLAVDRNGFLYTTGQYGAGDDTIRVFAPDANGEPSPVRVLAGPHSGIANPTGLAIDRDGNLYVGVNHGAAAPSQFGITVHVAGAGHDATPLRQLLGVGHRFNRMAGPDRLAIGRGDSLYVRSQGILAVYAPGARGATEPARLVFRNVPGPQFGRVYAPNLFALDPHDTLYALSGDTITVFAPGYSGSGAPIRTIAGPRTGLRDVTDMTVDHLGSLYVAMRGPKWDSSLVRVYAPGASGDAPSVRTISGGRTRLSMPTHLTVDRDGRLYVANAGDPGGAGLTAVSRPAVDTSLLIDPESWEYDMHPEVKVEIIMESP
jgi:hypothetical protein